MENINGKSETSHNMLNFKCLAGHQPVRKSAWQTYHFCLNGNFRKTNSLAPDQTVIFIAEKRLSHSTCLTK